MRELKCSHCEEVKPICYKDFAPGFQIVLCYDCLVKLDWKVEIERIAPMLRKCEDCGCFSLSKNPNSKRCYLCWDKKINGHGITIIPIKEEVYYENRKLQQF